LTAAADDAPPASHPPDLAVCPQVPEAFRSPPWRPVSCPVRNLISPKSGTSKARSPDCDRQIFYVNPAHRVNFRLNPFFQHPVDARPADRRLLARACGPRRARGLPGRWNGQDAPGCARRCVVATVRTADLARNEPCRLSGSPACSALSRRASSTFRLNVHSLRPILAAWPRSPSRRNLPPGRFTRLPPSRPGSALGR
jgi:hypothetical protein